MTPSAAADCNVRRVEPTDVEPCIDVLARLPEYFTPDTHETVRAALAVQPACAVMFDAPIDAVDCGTDEQFHFSSGRRAPCNVSAGGTTGSVAISATHDSARTGVFYVGTDVPEADVRAAMSDQAPALLGGPVDNIECSQDDPVFISAGGSASCYVRAGGERRSVEVAVAPDETLVVTESAADE